VNLCVAKRGADIGVKLAQEVSGRLVVANSEDGCDVGADVAKTLRTIALASAVDGGATNVSGTLPDDLTEVAPAVESSLVVDVGRGSLAVETAEVGSFVVVEQFGDNGGHVVSWAAGSDVLAVSATVGCDVVSIVARVGDLESSRSCSVVPSESWSRVVGAVSVVMVNDLGGVRVAAGGDDWCS